MTEVIIIPENGIVTVATFSKMVGVAENAIERMIERGDITALKFQKGSSKWLISLSAVNEYLKGDKNE